MSEKKGMLSSGLGMVGRNKRFIGWFYVLNLALAYLGAAAFRDQVAGILDHSLVADRLLHGFDITVFAEMMARPEFGPASAASMSAMHLAALFFVATALFLPGVFQAYASTYRLPRIEFFRACGQNLWRFIRLMIVAGIVMGIVAGALFGIQAAIGKKAVESTNEVLPFELQMAGLFVIFLVMTVLRIWFDLAEADTVLNDQRAVRKSIGSAFRHTFRNLGSLLGSYFVTTLVAAIILLGGLWCWMRFVPPASVAGAWIVGQLTLLLLLVPRFWQRGIAVAYWKQSMLVPVAVVEPIITPPVVEPVIVPASEPDVVPAVPPLPEPLPGT